MLFDTEWSWNQMLWNSRLFYKCAALCNDCVWRQIWEKTTPSEKCPDYINIDEYSYHWRLNIKLWKSSNRPNAYSSEMFEKKRKNSFQALWVLCLHKRHLSGVPQLPRDTSTKPMSKEPCFFMIDNEWLYTLIWTIWIGNQSAVTRLVTCQLSVDSCVIEIEQLQWASACFF